ncbi:Ankyrin repeat [Desulfurella amilsii]|uniref:Ankyrin repeat n=2 Tax=Desulfurella amilsii TaxID=1562698 RepID=A0A1X4XXC2_9BACT|nr:Ankyrin repeat [Desulfurella amilsii]
MLKKVIVFYGLLFLFASQSFARDEIYVIPQVALILPKNSSIQSFWLVNPQNYSAKHKVEFCVTNQAIVGYMNKFLFFPKQNSFLVVEGDYSGFLCLDETAVLFYSKTVFGYLKISPMLNNIPKVTIEPIDSLPSESKLFLGLDKTLYCLSFDNKTKTYKVYIFNKKIKPHAFVALYSQQEPISSVSGVGENIVIASQDKIYIVKDEKRLLYYDNQNKNFDQIVYTGYGIFYTTANSVGFIQNAQAMEFVKAKNPKIFLKDNVLFVMFPTNMGIIGLSNIDELRKYNFPVKSLKWKD